MPVAAPCRPPSSPKQDSVRGSRLMPGDKPTLDAWLGACYGALHGLAPADSHQRFISALQADSALHAQAEARLQTLETLEAACQGDIGKRCVLSKSAIDALRLALGKKPME